VKCEECGRYLDGLDPLAFPHPIVDTLCMTCGGKFVREEGWNAAMQRRRERVVYPETRKQ
jgi:ribosomal protein S27E